MEERQTMIPKTPEYPVCNIKILENAELMGDNLLVLLYPPEVQDGLIHLPEGARKQQAIAWVAKSPEPKPAIGRSVRTGEVEMIPSVYSAGDTILMPMHSIQALPELGRKDDKYGYVRISDVI